MWRSFYIMSQFNEYDLKHSSLFLHKLNNLKDRAINFIEVTYAELVALRDADKLKIGRYYRIIDYQTTTSQMNTTVANHSFDVIVLALGADVLSEYAFAIQRAQDEYFKNSTLEAWELKYCIDNDSNRFTWASSSGYGVIYYMKDEFGNEAGYDFKNIQFTKLSKLSDSFKALSLSEQQSKIQSISLQNIAWWTDETNGVISIDTSYYYTFSKIDGTDASLSSQCCNNVVELYKLTPTYYQYGLPFIVVQTNGQVHFNKFEQCSDHVFVQTEKQFTHNTITNACEYIYITGGYMEDSTISSSIYTILSTNSDKIRDCHIKASTNNIIWTMSEIKHIHIHGDIRECKIACESLQNHHFLGHLSNVTVLAPCYFLSAVFYPYCENITIQGSANWIEKITFLGCKNLTLDTPSKKIYSSIFYPGDYNNKTVADFNTTDNNTDSGLTFEYKPANSNTIIV